MFVLPAALLIQLLHSLNLREEILLESTHSKQTYNMSAWHHPSTQM